VYFRIFATLQSSREPFNSMFHLHISGSLWQTWIFNALAHWFVTAKAHHIHVVLLFLLVGTATATGVPSRAMTSYKNTCHACQKNFFPCSEWSNWIGVTDTPSVVYDVLAEAGLTITGGKEYYDYQDKLYYASLCNACTSKVPDRGQTQISVSQRGSQSSRCWNHSPGSAVQNSMANARSGTASHLQLWTISIVEGQQNVSPVLIKMIKMFLDFTNALLSWRWGGAPMSTKWKKVLRPWIFPSSLLVAQNRKPIRGTGFPQRCFEFCSRWFYNSCLGQNQHVCVSIQRPRLLGMAVGPKLMVRRWHDTRTWWQHTSVQSDHIPTWTLPSAHHCGNSPALACGLRCWWYEILWLSEDRWDNQARHL